MTSFETQLSPSSWTEILQGGTYIAFDVVAASPAVDVHLSESAATPADDAVASPIQTWPNGWDFELSGVNGGMQRVWARGGLIRGVRE